MNARTNFSWATPIDQNDIENPPIEVGPQNTMYRLTDGVVEETIAITTTTITTTITRTLSTIEQLRQQLFDRNVDQISELMKNVIAPSILRAVLERNLSSFPPMVDTGDSYIDPTRVAVFLSDATFQDWAVDKLMREYWRHKLLEHHSEDLDKALASRYLRDEEDLLVAFTLQLAESSEFKGIVNRADLTKEYVKAEVLKLAKKFLNDKIREQRERDKLTVSLDLTVANEEGEESSLAECGLFGVYADQEGRMVVGEQDLSKGRKWNGHENVAPKFDPRKAYREGSRASFDGINYVSLVDFHQGKCPDVSPDFWEIEEDAPPLPTPKHRRKRRRKGRFVETSQWLQCDRYLCVLLKDTPLRFADILRACENPLGTGQKFGRDRVKSSLKRVAYRVDGRWCLSIESMIKAQQILKDANISHLDAEREARLNAWRVWPDGRVRGGRFNYRFSENIGADAAEDYTISGPDNASEPDVDIAELKSLYRKATMVVHPDRFVATEAREQIDSRTDTMIKLNSAYERGDLAEIKLIYAAYVSS